MNASAWLSGLAGLIWLYAEWWRRQPPPNSVEHDAPHRLFARRNLGDADFDTAAASVHAIVADGYAYRARPYRRAADAVAGFLAQMQRRPPRALAHFNTLAAIRVYLLREDWDAAARAREGWTEARRRDEVESAQRCLAMPQWTAVIEDGLGSRDDATFDAAAHAAAALGRDCDALHWQRLLDKPADPVRWFRCACGADAERAAALVALASQVLPLAQLADVADGDDSNSTVPGDSGLPAGPPPHDDAAYAQWVVLELVLEQLIVHPEPARAVLLAGFNSALARSRQLALIAFLRWPPLRHDAELRSALQRAADAEPDERVQQNFRAVLADSDPESGPVVTT